MFELKEDKGDWLAGIFDSGRVGLIDRMVQGKYRYFAIKLSGKTNFIEAMREEIGFGHIYSYTMPDDRQLFITGRRDILLFISMIYGRVKLRKKVLEEFKKNVEESMRESLKK